MVQVDVSVNLVQVGKNDYLQTNNDYLIEGVEVVSDSGREVCKGVFVIYTSKNPKLISGCCFLVTLY